VVNTNSGKCVDAANRRHLRTAPRCSSGPVPPATPTRVAVPAPAAATTRSSSQRPERGVGRHRRHGATGTARPSSCGFTARHQPAVAAHAQSGGSYTFTARNSGNECLDVTNRSTANGRNSSQWACTAGDTAQPSSSSAVLNHRLNAGAQAAASAAGVQPSPPVRQATIEPGRLKSMRKALDLSSHEATEAVAARSASLLSGPASWSPRPRGRAERRPRRH